MLRDAKNPKTKGSFGKWKETLNLEEALEVGKNFGEALPRNWRKAKTLQRYFMKWASASTQRRYSRETGRNQKIILKCL